MVGKLAKGLNLSDIAHKHDIPVEYLKEELVEGIKTETEHTNDYHEAKAIAMDHLYEMPDYYSKLKEVEGLDNHLKYANGGQIFSFSTPTGNPSKLSYLQQVLIRTSAFKNFFGDWESAAKKFLNDNRNNFLKHYENVSKIISADTLEPKLVFHGTLATDEFYEFQVSGKSPGARPYAYFAFNKEYSKNFSTSISNPNQGFLYNCFLNIRHPFIASTSKYYDTQQNADYWIDAIIETLSLDKYGDTDKKNLNKIRSVVTSQIEPYIRSAINADVAFWRLMARDNQKEFKRFLTSHGFDGIIYYEEISGNYDVDNPAEYTKAAVIFEPNQVKLADGRNLDFNPHSLDIRFKEGGKIDQENSESIQEDYRTNVISARRKLDNIISGKYAEGGVVIAKNNINPNDAKKGGYFKGRSHADGGIKAINKDTGQVIEVEGKEVIINKKSVSDPSLHEFDGKKMTNKEILSKINQSGGGVAFADGGEVCGCNN